MERVNKKHKYSTWLLMIVGVFSLIFLVMGWDTGTVDLLCRNNFNFLYRLNDEWGCLSVPMAEMYMTGNLIVTPLTANNPAKVRGLTILNNHSNLFNMSDNNTLTYYGENPSLCHAANTLSVSSTGANDVVIAFVTKNDIEVQGSRITTKLSQVGDITSTAIHTAPYLTYGDNVSFYILNENNNNDYTVKEANMFIMCYPMD